MKLRQISFAVCCVVLLSWSVATASAAAEGSFQRTLKVSGAVDLDIETGSGNIEIRTGSSDQVQITGHIRANNNSWFGSSGGDAAEKVKRIEANPPIQQSGNDIRIGHIDDQSLRRNISISYELIVPADTRLRSRTGSGNQNAVGLKGAIDLQTGSGNVVFSNIGNTVRAESGSGNIEADHVNGNVRAKSGSGEIRVQRSVRRSGCRIWKRQYYPRPSFGWLCARINWLGRCGLERSTRIARSHHRQRHRTRRRRSKGCMASAHGVRFGARAFPFPIFL